MADFTIITDMSIPRGIRNNNPGNIKPEGIDWQGATGDDGVFVIFKDLSWGLRALATDLVNKISKDGLNTVRSLINKYAPPSENVTTAYVSAVSSELGIGPDDPLALNSETIHNLVRAVINHENGEGVSGQYVSDADIDQGIGMMNANLSSLFQAAVIAAQANPAPTVAVSAALVLILIFIFK